MLFEGCSFAEITFERLDPLVTTYILGLSFFAPKTSNAGCACYVRSRCVAARLTKVINLIGNPILGVKKPEVKPSVLQT